MGAIVVLAIVAMAIVAALYPEKGPAVADTTTIPGAQAPPPPPVDPNATTGPTPDPLATGTPAPGQSPGQPPTGAPTTTAPPTPGAVTGGYAVTHTEQEWGNRFEARINLTNSSGTEQPWVVTLVYPNRVTGFAAAWVEGQSLPDKVVNQPIFTIVGKEAIAPGKSITVWVQFDLGPGDPVSLTECRINGTACQIF